MSISLPVKQLCRRHGFSQASYYFWRNKYGGLSVSDAKRVKELTTESARPEPPRGPCAPQEPPVGPREPHRARRDPSASAKGRTPRSLQFLLTPKLLASVSET